MKVWVRGIGDLQEYFGKEPREVLLREDAVLSDLLQVIDEQWGKGLPPYMWNRDKHLFRGPVLCVVDRKAIQDLNTPLMDGVEIRIMRAVAGG